MLISPRYRDLNKRLHESSATYGANAWKDADAVVGLARRYSANTLLDYGCGKGTLKKILARPAFMPDLKVYEYDPALNKDERRVCDIAVCLDVLEHIEPAYLHDVLADLRAWADKALFVKIATRESRKRLEDGRNAHLIIEDGAWWFREVSQLFTVVNYQNNRDREVYIEAT